MRSEKSSHPKGILSNPYVVTFFKTFKPECTFEDKNEFLDIVYWLRQVFAVIIGIVWGLIPLKGFFAILLFFFVNILAVYLYAALFQRVDEDEYGGFAEIVKEGLMTAFSCFMVSWIVVYDYGRSTVPLS
ncbi:hypothetical protein CSKR_202382 [Clonorchis sinensis]|uniref:Rab5-interacting protein n=1 Tax=Clonorchis sinensis TaxID=79923 RepID=A0A8T1MVB7_CLOSI|nr:hypothetical protein CSKR_202382 [Clonorchis sinensis]